MVNLRIVDALKCKPSDQEITIQGWVRTRRDSKEFSFIEVGDGSSLKGLQVVAEASLPDYESAVLSAHTGAALQARGQIVASAGKGQTIELKAREIQLLGACDAAEYPLQKKKHSNEFLREIAHLRPRTNTFGAVFRVRSAAAFAVHKFFQERRFVYLHSPIISTSDCEGAGEMFTVTTLPLDNIPFTDAGPGGQKLVDHGKDFFGAHAGLTVSGQLEGECFALALGEIYTFGPTFRAENSNTARHLAEFWMIEPEMAFYDLARNADLAEAFTKYVISYVLQNCQEDMEFFEKWIEPGIIKSLESVANSNFERITYTEAIKVLEGAKSKFEFPVSWGVDLQTEHERFLTEEHIGRPVFVTNYPKQIKAFYMRLDEGEKTVSAMDLLVPRLGEIIGGSQREEREDILRRRIHESMLPEENYWWYLELRKYGTAKHAGFGLGFERLIMYLTGMTNIRDVIPFPRTPGNARF